MQEPLLKDEEEKLVVTPNNKLTLLKKKGKKINWNKDTIITIILALVILWFFGKNVVHPYYMGFKYYNLRFEKEEIEEVIEKEDEEQEISNNSAILLNTYNQINVDNCLNSVYLLNRLYGNTLVNNLSNDEQMQLILNYYNVLNQDTFTITLVELKELSIKLFNNENIDIYLIDKTYDNYQVTYDSVNELFNVSIISPNTCSNDFLIRKIDHATTKGDELYIYEKFGYFKLVENNNYEIYGDSLLINLIGNYLDTDGTKNYLETSNLKTYKWTFKKGNNDNYYFVSITPE
ncbi:MAG: hypothetical protein ACLUFU_00300 [Bacilli bacterium]